MDASLLTIRLRLKECPLKPPPEPVIRVGTTCVGALWSCGCACVGEDFESVAFVGCTLHREYMESRSIGDVDIRRVARPAITTRGEFLPRAGAPGRLR
jgi:hypothetical protein